MFRIFRIKFIKDRQDFQDEVQLKEGQYRIVEYKYLNGSDFYYQQCCKRNEWFDKKLYWKTLSKNIVSANCTNNGELFSDFFYLNKINQ